MKMSNFRSVSSMVLAVLCFDASAGEYATTIERIGAVSNDTAIMVVTTPLPTKPSCATETNVVSFDISTTQGKLFYSNGLAALMAGKSLYVYYSDAECRYLGTRTLVTRSDVLK